jgi:hypothetical protein
MNSEQTNVVERLVRHYMATGSLPPLPTTPSIAASKEATPKVLVLDMLAWIGLAQAQYGRANAPPGAAEALNGIRAATATGKLVVPVTGMNLGEATTPRDASRRRRLATFMVELSGNLSIINETVLTATEFEIGIRRTFGGEQVSRDLRSEMVVAGMYGGAVGHTDTPVPNKAQTDQIAALMTRDQAVSMIRRVQNDPSVSIELIVGTHNRARDEALRLSEEATVRRLEAIRQNSQGTPEPERVRREVDGILGDGLHRPVIERLSLDIGSVRRWLNEDTAAALVAACPSLDVMMRMLLAVNRNRQLPLQVGDYRDFTLLRVGVAYANFVVTENRWTAIVRDEGIAERHITTVLNQGDLGKLPRILEEADCL